MGFLRRLFGDSTPDAAPDRPVAPADLEALEREHELEIARSEQERLSELQQRQLRYANYASEPPAQGGERRAEDGDQPADS